MSKTYDLKLVYDYIWGNDIEGYDIEEMENDPSFMVMVLEKTHDKNMYELCSDVVKKNYSFVREIVALFKDDLKFVTGVANTYLDSLTDAEKEQGRSYIELNIIMSNLCGKSLNEYSITAAAFYEYERCRAKLCINAFEDKSMSGESREGFVVTAVQYEDSPIIVDFVAKRMLLEALYGEDYNSLETLIHRRFKSVEEFKSYGEMRFLQDCINSFDESLSSYAFDRTRPEAFEMFFEQIFKDVSDVERKWDVYMDRVNSWRVDVFQHEMSEFMLDEGILGNLSYDEIISYVANKLGVVEVFQRFDPEFSFAYDEEKYRILDTADVNCLNKAKALATKLFSVDVIDDSDDDYVGVDGSEIEAVPVQKNSSQSVIRFKLIDDEDKYIKNKTGRK